MKLHVVWNFLQNYSWNEKEVCGSINETRLAMSWKLLKLGNGSMHPSYYSFYFCMFVCSKQFINIYPHGSRPAWKRGTTEAAYWWMDISKANYKGLWTWGRARSKWKLGLSMETCIRGDCLILCFCAYTIPSMHPLTNPPLIPGVTFPDYVSKYPIPPLTKPPFTTALAFFSSSMPEHEDEVVGRPVSAQWLGWRELVKLSVSNGIEFLEFSKLLAGI